MTTHTHWKKLTNPTYLGEWDIPEGQDLLATIRTVSQEEVKDKNGKSEMVPVLYWEEQLKPLILNKTNMTNISKALKTPYIEEWAGQTVQLYKEMVSAFGTVTMAVRIRDFKPEVNNG